MLIYRVEHEAHGHGPYIIPCDFYPEDEVYDEIMSFADSLAIDHCDEQHPTPAAIWMRKGHVCGFDSMDALRDWFEGYTYDLDYYGFVVRTFEAPDDDVWSGGYGQVTFDKSQAKCLTTERI